MIHKTKNKMQDYRKYFTLLCTNRINRNMGQTIVLERMDTGVTRAQVQILLVDTRVSLMTCDLGR